ncbi:MAG: hypothetical protein ABL883_02080 [Terricaulis sp.]
MSVWLAWARNAAIAWATLTLFAGAATQLFAAIFGYAAQFGEPIAYWYGHPLYHPWHFLTWGLELEPVRPWIAFLCMLLAVTFVLAAFAVLVLARLIPPVELPRFELRRGFACWDILGQHGLLGANGLALGAVRRHRLAKPELVSAPSGNVLIVGDPEHTDNALLSAISVWRGALVFVDARGLALRLQRKNVIRFAPDRADSAGYNPMLAIRGRAYAWADALLLVRSFLQTSDPALTDAFAVLVLDQLLTAPLEHRNLAAIRRRLAQPHRVLADFCATWGEQHCSAPAPDCEIARAVQTWRAHPNATLDRLAKIDAALALFDDGAFAQATETHQFRFADLVAGDGADTLVISPSSGAATHATPLIAALLAQLVAECAAAPDVDHRGRARKRELLVVIDADASAALGVLLEGKLLIPAQALRNCCRLLLQARGMEQAPSVGLDAIAAIGPQGEPTSARLSELGGSVPVWERLVRQQWRDTVFPAWGRGLRPIVSQQNLTGAHAEDAFLLLKGVTPIRARAVHVDASQTTFVNSAGLPPAPHDWAAPPLARVETPPQALAAPANLQRAGVQPAGAQIRKALTRRAPPASKTKAKNP